MVVIILLIEKAVPSISPHSSISQLQTVEESDNEEPDINPAVSETRRPAMIQEQVLGVNGYSILSFISRSQTTV